MLFDIDHFVEEANFLSQKCYKTDKKRYNYQHPKLRQTVPCSSSPNQKTKPNLEINVFGWENDHVIVYRISEKDSAIPRINLILIQQLSTSVHVALWKGLLLLVHDQNAILRVSHFCERCLHGYQIMNILERHKPECKGLLKSRGTRTELQKEGENKASFTNYHKQMHPASFKL